MTKTPARTARGPGSIIRVAAFLLLAMPVAAPAQEAREPQPGVRVRVTHVRGQQIGTLRSVDGDSVRFTTIAGVDLALPAGEVALLEQSTGVHRQFWKHLAMVSGGLIAAGGVLGFATYEPCESTGFMSCFMAPGSRGEAMLLGGALGGIVGVPLGLLAGVAIQTERWAPVTAVGHALSGVSIRMTPLHGVGVTVTYVLGSGVRR